MPAVHDDAVCVRHWDWSETSQTVSLFTREHGLVRVLAKGSKRPKSPYSGGIELLTRGEAGIILKPHAELGVLTAWDLVETFPPLRRSLAAHNAGLYMADVIQHAVTDRDPHPPLYDAMVDALRRLDTAAGPMGALLEFQWALLVETGYRPRLEAEPLPNDPTPPGTVRAYLFSPSLGGVVPAPAPGDAFRVEQAGWSVRAETLEVLRGVEAGGPAAVPAASPKALERANRLLAAYIRFILGREPRTLPLVFGADMPR